MDGTLTGITTLDKSGPGNNGYSKNKMKIVQQWKLKYFKYCQIRRKIIIYNIGIGHPVWFELNIQQ